MRVSPTDTSRSANRWLFSLFRRYHGVGLEQVGTDLFEINGCHYLVLVDYFSNFIEVASLKRDTRATTVIKHIKENIARYGIMDELISDNGPQYASTEFANFTAAYGIKHITSSPLHQQSNGLAAKAVQTVKSICAESGDDVYLSLLNLRNTPRDNETGSPTLRLMGRRAKTRLPITTKLREPNFVNSERVASKLMNYRRLVLWTPGPVPFGTCICSNVETIFS